MFVRVQKVRQAVQMLRYEDGHPGRMRHQVEAPPHTETRCQGLEFLAKAVQVESVQLPFHPHKEEFGFRVLMLIGMCDVGAVSIKKVGDGCDQTFTVWTVDKENSRIPHCELA